MSAGIIQEFLSGIKKREKQAFPGMILKRLNSIKAIASQHLKFPLH